MVTTSAVLVPHPWTPSPAVRAIGVEIGRSARHELAVRYRLDGELARLRIPPPAPTAIADRLWEHTCFEAFVAVAGERGYRELNFSPSGAWALFEFRGYRDGGAVADPPPAPAIAVETSDAGLMLAATVALDEWGAPYRDRPLRLGLSAVVEDVDGGRSYWALRHGAGRPDFHDADARVLQLAVPERAA